MPKKIFLILINIQLMFKFTEGDFYLFCLLLYARCLEQRLAHSKCSINILSEGMDIELEWQNSVI